MSKLLIDIEPLQVLPSLAKVIGLNEAIFLQQLHYWLRRSEHEHDGRRWVYNTFEEWHEQFPFWSLRTMQRIAASLVEKNLLKVRRFNSRNWDQKNWYSIEYETLSALKLDSDKLASSSRTDCRSLDHAKMAVSLTETTQETTTKEPPLPPVKSPPKPAPTPPYLSNGFLEAFAAFEQHRREIKHPLTPTARAALFNKLKRFGEDMAIRQLYESIENGWQGVFEPKPNGNHLAVPMNRGGIGKLVI